MKVFEGHKSFFSTGRHRCSRIHQHSYRQWTRRHQLVLHRRIWQHPESVLDQQPGWYRRRPFHQRPQHLQHRCLRRPGQRWQRGQRVRRDRSDRRGQRDRIRDRIRVRKRIQRPQRVRIQGHTHRRFPERSLSRDRLWGIGCIHSGSLIKLWTPTNFICFVTYFK